MKNNLFLLCCSFIFMHCSAPMPVNPNPYQIITLDPGHFHAALVQKSMYPGVDSTVRVYAPGGPDLDMHLQRIKNYNERKDQPTRWNEVVYTGPDFFERMIADKKGNLVVLSGNNRLKPDYILGSLEAGMHVLADKPMIIQYEDFEKLKTAFELAKQKNILLYDIMTERDEVSTLMQRTLSMNKDLFGELEKGSLEQPAITKESVHHLYKTVSGNVLVRPSWFLDVRQQGEGLVDVMTHLVDLVQWECFPDQIIDTQDIRILKARRWTTDLNLEKFTAITQSPAFPDFLHQDLVQDTLLKVYCNGEINYTIKGIHAKTSVIWNYKAPEGSGDTHYSIMRGTKSDLIIRQGANENYQPTLYLEPRRKGDTSIALALKEQIKNLDFDGLGIQFIPTEHGWRVSFPANMLEGHEAHFARVMEKFLSYLKDKNMPAWEVPNMLAKYYTTTKALEWAMKDNGL
ncbi:MAG TPA: putative oxidoreductase C-terminal domain-containing protein [Saprospiraceae bacterium]|nr:putative oxidoreductase C-terminal domain-containing protein [Saprospiraceae bacterium]HNT20486.1 putative oxidoreductase C-terminal domain-containing protein [Saprospiraceae bacterium]